MAMMIQTIECFPRPVVLMGTVLPAPDADHEHCPKGQTTPGVMGGWLCCCPCHRSDAARSGK